MRSDKAWADWSAANTPTWWACVACDAKVSTPTAGTTPVVRGWLPAYDRKWMCQTCWRSPGWTAVRHPISASVWPVGETNDGADAGLPTGWFMIEAHELVGAEGWWLSDGCTSISAAVGSWLVVQEDRARVEPAEWLGTLMIEAGVMADEPF